MKIYYKLNKKKVRSLKDLTFCGLVTMDIGYKTFGITIINKKGEYHTIDLKPFKNEVKIAKLSIPDYLILAYNVLNKILKLIEKKPILLEYCWELEIPNIVGSFAPALSILLNTLYIGLMERDIPVFFFMGNRLGGYYLKKRSYTKTEIKNLVKDKFNVNYKLSDHEADSLLHAYSIYLGVFKKHLNNTSLREFEVDFEELKDDKFI